MKSDFSYSQSAASLTIRHIYLPRSKDAVSAKQPGNSMKMMLYYELSLDILGPGLRHYGGQQAVHSAAMAAIKLGRRELGRRRRRRLIRHA